MSLARLTHAAVVLAAIGLLGAASPAPAAPADGTSSYIAPRPMGAHHLTVGLHCETREIS